LPHDPQESDLENVRLKIRKVVSTKQKKKMGTGQNLVGGKQSHFAFRTIGQLGGGVSDDGKCFPRCGKDKKTNNAHSSDQSKKEVSGFSVREVSRSGKVGISSTTRRDG